MKRNRMYNLQHFILTTKYRQPYLEHPMLKAWTKYYIQRICKIHDVQLLALAIMDEHVHILVELPRRYSISDCMRDLKFHTSYNLRRKFKPLKEKNALWGVSYFHRSVGGDEAIVRNYINDHFGDES